MAPDQTLPALLEDRAATAPAHSAILSPDGESLSYAALVDRVASIGRQLRGAGVRPGDRVAIVLPNGPEMAVAFFGVSAHAAAAPLNPAYRASELAFYFDDLQPRALVASDRRSAAASLAAERGIPFLDPNRPDPDAGLVSRNPARARPEDVALVLHTSGTTSRPKMVPLTHAGLCASAANIAATLALTAVDRCLNVMPLFHVHGLVGALLSSVAAGAGVVCTPGFTAARFFDWLADCEPTWYTAVPTMHLGILARVDAHREIVARHTLRVIRSSSAPLAPTLMQALEDAFGVPVLEAYGMTEASHQIACNPLPPRARKPGSVGVATGPEIGVVDETGNLLPPGAPGEIVLRGATLTTGYLGGPAATESAFVRGWFRTGDSGYVDDEGYVFLVGRLKEIINRGGEKISPREVDEVLLRHPGVADAVTFPVPDVRLGEDVAAAVVPKTGATIDRSDLRRFAAERLADFKVPRTIHVVGELPKGPTGKIQRTTLAAAIGTAPPVHDAAPARRDPPTTLERDLAAIWCEMLRIDEVGVHDDFFLAGGDSLLATLLIVRVSDALGVEIALVDFMETPTVAGMAAVIEAGGRRRPQHGLAGVLVPIRPQGSGLALFCAPPMDGTLLGYARMSARLGPDRPVWGFAPPRLSPGRWTFSIAEIAATYVRAMRAEQPQGPYLLLGDCFGGHVAYEMAAQLERDGSEVGLLAMVDAFNGAGWRRQHRAAARLARRADHALARVRYHLAAVRVRVGDSRRSYLGDRFRGLAWNLRHRALGIVYKGCVRLGLTVPAAARDIRHANVLAELRSTPRPIHAPAALFRTTAPAAGSYPSRLMGWEDLLKGEARVIDVPGEHLTRFADGTVERLADLVAEELARVDARPGVAAAAGGVH